MEAELDLFVKRFLPFQLRWDDRIFKGVFELFRAQLKERIFKGFFELLSTQPIITTKQRELEK